MLVLCAESDMIGRKLEIVPSRVKQVGMCHTDRLRRVIGLHGFHDPALPDTQGAEGLPRLFVPAPYRSDAHAEPAPWVQGIRADVRCKSLLAGRGNSVYAGGDAQSFTRLAL